MTSEQWENIYSPTTGFIQILCTVFGDDWYNTFYILWVQFHSKSKIITSLNSSCSYHLAHLILNDGNQEQVNKVCYKYTDQWKYYGRLELTSRLLSVRCLSDIADLS
jgi:hypothetical protein